MARLVIEAPEALRNDCELKGRTTLGRQPDNTIPLLDREVSKRHCQIDQVGNDFFLSDLGSLNGTFLNGQKVTEATILRDGDLIVISEVRARFRTESEPAATPMEATPSPTVVPPPPEPLPPPPPFSSALLASPSVPPPPPYQLPPSSPPLPPPIPVPPSGFARTDGDVPSRTGSQTRFITVDESLVQGKVAMDTRRFVPEKDLIDIPALRRDYERLRIAYEMITRIGQELDLDVLLDRILEMCFEMLPADRGVILIYGEDGALAPRALRQRDPGSNEVMEISTSMVKMVEREWVGILCSDAARDPRFQQSQSIIFQAIRSSMAVPLQWRERLLGILILDCKHAINVFREKDLQVLSAIAGQAAMFVANTHLVREKQEEAVARERLQRLFSPDIADLIVKGKAEVKPGGEPKRATILFSDLRGFTALSETMTAAAIVQMLNRYFERMVDVIFRFGGTLDKFVGDEIMALFGAPFGRADDPERAVRCALAMLEALDPLNAERVAVGQPPLQIGIGINSGDVVAGYIGSPKALQYTLIGAPVNLASRLCSQARNGNWIVISETTWEAVRDLFETRELEPAPLKGISRPLRTFAVVREKR